MKIISLKRILLAFLVFTFCNVITSQNNIEPNKTIKIGLLIADSKLIEAKFGATSAIREANLKGGINGVPLQLVIRSMEGAWGTGSKEAVNMVFKEKVWAILGSHDGRNAHLVEQVIAKTQTIFLSAWATDSTLSQAFVPWYFSCVPNDIQQAIALVDEIYNKKKLTKITIVSDNSYDSELAVQSILKQTKLLGVAEPIQLFYNNSNKDFETSLDEINKNGSTGIILLGQSSTSWKFIKHLRQNKMNQPVFGSISLLGEYELNEPNYDNVLVVSSGNWLGSKELFFQNEFQKKYGKMPGAAAAYAYDGMNLIIEAIKYSGLDKSNIKENLSNMNYNGVTGVIKFDKKGNRLGAVKLTEIHHKISNIIN